LTPDPSPRHAARGFSFAPADGRLGLNPKSEARNPKQIPSTKKKIPNLPAPSLPRSPWERGTSDEERRPNPLVPELRLGNPVVAKLGFAEPRQRRTAETRSRSFASSAFASFSVGPREAGARRAPVTVWDLLLRDFGFVSDFVLRISSFAVPARGRKRKAPAESLGRGLVVYHVSSRPCNGGRFKGLGSPSLAVRPVTRWNRSRSAPSGENAHRWGAGGGWR
jgi:hypothetical protein